MTRAHLKALVKNVITEIYSRNPDPSGDISAEIIKIFSAGAPSISYDEIYNTPYSFIKDVTPQVERYVFGVATQTAKQSGYMDNGTDAFTKQEHTNEVMATAAPLNKGWDELALDIVRLFKTGDAEITWDALYKLPLEYYKDINANIEHRVYELASQCARHFGYTENKMLDGFTKKNINENDLWAEPESFQSANNGADGYGRHDSQQDNADGLGGSETPNFLPEGIASTLKTKVKTIVSAIQKSWNPTEDQVIQKLKDMGVTYEYLKKNNIDLRSFLFFVVSDYDKTLGGPSLDSPVSNFLCGYWPKDVEKWKKVYYRLTHPEEFEINENTTMKKSELKLLVKAIINEVRKTNVKAGQTPLKNLPESFFADSAADLEEKKSLEQEHRGAKGSLVGKVRSKNFPKGKSGTLTSKAPISGGSNNAEAIVKKYVGTAKSVDNLLDIADVLGVKIPITMSRFDPADVGKVILDALYTDETIAGPDGKPTMTTKANTELIDKAYNFIVAAGFVKLK